MKNRIIGIDVARALAIIGMIIVNFKIALGDKGSTFFKIMTGVFEGKASATFVVLAGVGIAFMTNSAITNKETIKLAKIKVKIIKRAAFLFLIGIIFIPIWPADILHFYGIYMLITVLVLTTSRSLIFNLALLLVLIYPLLMMIGDYDSGWNFTNFEYSGFWTLSGFLRHLLFNGFHPVIPWTAFMLLGLWFGKQELSNNRFIIKSIKVSGSVFILMLFISKSFIALFSEGNPVTEQELMQVLGTSPMPPLPVYMISASSIAIFVISACILIAKKHPNHLIIVALNKTGQLALTFYVAHVVVGMGLIETINPASMGHYSIVFSLIYALTFSFVCIVFAMIWTRFFKSGPLEWLLRKLTK